MIPAREASLLPEKFASYSRNTWLYRGSLQGFKSPLTRYTTTSSGVQAIYRIPLGAATELSNSKWVELATEYTDVLWAPVIGDAYQRYYFFSPTQAPQYNPLSAIQANATLLTLGIPTPTAAPTIAVVASTNTETVTRSYVYTWVSAYGEEGAPSAPTVVTGRVGSTFNVTVTAPTTAQRQNRNLTTVRLYRTVTDAAGRAAYYLVAAFSNNTVLFADNISDTAVTSNGQLESSYWTPPPLLKGAVAMSNGIIAGWANDNEIWFSEPYRPHAWPATYSISVPYKIVGLGVVGTSLVVATEGPPYLATGITPASMSLQDLPLPEPCVSRGSIVSSADGVFYASANGLVQVNNGVARLVTQNLLTREDWGKLNPASWTAGKYGTSYIAFCKNGSLSNGTGDNGVIIDASNENVMFSQLRYPTTVKSVSTDNYTGNVYILSDTNVSEWDAQGSTTQQPYVWRSKLYQMPYKQEFVAAIAYFDVPSSVTIPTPTDATRTITQPHSFNPNTQYFIIKVYADGVLRATREVQRSGELILLPSGFKANYYQFEIEGQVAVKNIQIATSVKELRQI